MTQEEEVTRNLTLIEYYKDQLNSLEFQSQYIQAALTDYHKAKLTVEHMKSTSHQSDIMYPIGGGAFLTGAISDPSKVLVNVGAGYLLEKSIDDAIKKIDERIAAAEENLTRLNQMAQQIQSEATDLSEKTQKLMQEAQQQ